MNNELEDIILTIDTREQNQTRIKAVEDWFTGHKAIVEHSALKHCDYRLIGEFRGISVNLGVEAKGWDNFLSDDIAEMEEKLLLATGEYDHVGFFVETQNYSFVPDENNKHGKLNYSIPRLNKNLPAKTLAAFEGFLDIISKHPQIHVRQLRGEAQFPYSLYDLLVYLQKPHTLTVRPEGYVPSLQNLYMQIPQVGVERAKKLIQHYPNLFWLSSASEPSLVEVMGQSMGTILYQFLHNSELLTPEWRVGHHLDGTEKYKTICGQDCYNPQHCNTLCERHPNNTKNLKKQDNEGRLAFDAPAKNPIASDESIAIMAAIEGYLSGFPEGRTANEICEHFNLPSGDGDRQKLLQYIKRLAWDKRITSEGNLFKVNTCDYADPKNRAECKTPDHFKKWDLQCRKCKTIQTVPIKERKPKCIKCRSNEFDIVFQHSSHAEGTILSNHNTPLIPSADTSQSLSNSQAIPFKDTGNGRASKRPDKYGVAVTHDTSSHPGSFLNLVTSHPWKPDDLQGIPPIETRKSPAETDIGLDGNTYEYREVKPNVIDPHTQKMNLKETIKEFMADDKPHEMQEIVDHCEGWTPGNVFQHVMGAVKSGYFKERTEQDGRKITFQRIT